MQSTYARAMQQVFADEGGYTNDPHDPGGPTNWGITLSDARQYWKSSATAIDVQDMPKPVAEDIYEKHYATPLRYNDLPAGVDYAVLDYGINSGIHRSITTLQQIVGVPVDGVIGPITLAAVNKMHPADIINGIYNSRMQFLMSLHTWMYYKNGWTSRCNNGRMLAMSMTTVTKPPIPPLPTPPIQAPAPKPTETRPLFQFFNFLLSFIKGKTHAF